MSGDKIVERGKLLLGYLPAIYSMDADSEAFLEKFLGIFGNEIINMEEKIADIPRYFDPEALTSDEDDFLSWLTSWLSLDFFSQYSSLNRDYMLMASQFYKAKGTEAGLIALLEFFSDGKVCVTDRSAQIFMTYNKELVHDEYHTESYTLNTDDKALLAKMPHKYGDTVHYIFGDDTYVIDAYLAALDKLADDDPKFAILKKLVEPFVPAIWKVEINKMNEPHSVVVEQKLLGNDDQSWDRAALSTGYLGMQKFTAVAGVLGEIRIKCSGIGHIQVAIYSDVAGSPGSVLAYAMAAPVSSGWNTISLNIPVELTATNYWLAYDVDTNNIIWIKNTGGIFKYKSLAYGTPFPDTPLGLTDLVYNMAIAGWGLIL